MMKRSLFLFSLLSLSTIAQAQVARWLIKPAYEKIDMVYGTNLMMADSADSKVIFSQNGRRLASTTDNLFDFREGHALTIKPGTAEITSIINQNGRVTPITGYQLGANAPFFTNGYALVFDGQYFHYMDTNGKVWPTEYSQAQPFFSGYASCFRYDNARRMKDPTWQLLDSNLKPVPLRWENRQFVGDDVQFVSSVNDEGLAFVVAKDKVYTFNGNTKALDPLFINETERNARNQAKLIGEFYESFASQDDTLYVLTARCGRNDFINITFSSMYVPLSIARNDQVQTYSRRPPERQLISTQMKSQQGSNGLYALYWGDELMLPAQFEKVARCFDENAIVQLSGKYGVLRLMRNDHFTLLLNDGHEIGFRHRTYPTTLRLNMPAYIPGVLTNVDVENAGGLTIDKLRKDGRDTPDGNFIEYPCVLTIPNNISSDEKRDIGYTMQVVYDGLRSAEQKVTVPAWHYNYYTVDANEQEATINNGSLSITFDIGIDRRLGDADYSKTFDLKTDLNYEIEPVSETRYKCKVFGLKEGVNVIQAVITEEGCPPFYYPFEVEYVKPTTHSSRPSRATVRKQTPVNRVLDV